MSRPFHHHATARTSALLLGHQHVPHTCDGRQPRSRLGHFPGANRIGDIHAIQEDIVFRPGSLLLRRWRLQLDMGFGR